jgi:putative hemolysin
MNYIIIHIIILIILLLLSAFFSGTETALFSLKKSDLHRFSESKKQLENSIAHMMNYPEKILITLLIGNLFVNLSLTAIATNFMLSYFGHYGHLITIAFVTPLIIILSEITPKIIAINNYRSFSKSIFPYIYLFHKIISPLRYFILFFSDLLIKFLNLNLQHSSLTEDELGHVITSGEKQGLINKQESEILKNVLRFTRKEASNIMYPRNQAIFIEYGSSVEEAMVLILENEVVRIPVYKNDPDNIIGVIDSRVMISSFKGNRKKNINKFIRPIDFFPFSKDLNELLNDFLRKKIQIAIIVDEYGGTAGVATLNSILSALLGRDFGKWENFKRDMVRNVGDDNYIVYGEMQLDEFNTFFNLNINSSNSDTIGGYVIEQLSSIPEKGDSIIIENLELKIKSVIKRTIKTIDVKTIHHKRNN